MPCRAKKKKGIKISALGFLCSKPQANVVFSESVCLGKISLFNEGIALCIGTTLFGMRGKIMVLVCLVV